MRALRLLNGVRRVLGPANQPMSEQAPAAAPAPAPAGAKSKSKFIILIVAVLALAGGGAGGAFFYINTHKGPAAPPPPPEPGITALEPFVVNLADGGGRRFLRVTVKLVVEKKDEAKELEENEVDLAKVRSSVLEVLTTQSAEHLVTPEGKAELKKEIAEHASEALEHIKITDVLFTEFVVQF
jgi:flagellar protein FliL